jgi:hypothetical protein
MKQPIDSAPRDGTTIFVTTSALGICSFRAKFDGDKWVFACPGDHLDGVSFQPQPIHWFPERTVSASAQKERHLSADMTDIGLQRPDQAFGEAGKSL